MPSRSLPLVSSSLPVHESWTMAAKVSVLVVEDEVLIRMDIADFLEHQGFEVLEAGDADEAIGILQSNQSIRLVITDVDMPGTMDGLKLAAAIRKRWPPVRLVVMSGHRIVDIADLPDGSVFFAKPFQNSQMLKSMRQLLA